MSGWAREVLACAGFAAAFLLLFAAGEVLRRVCRWHPEATRKTVHLAGCLIAMLFPVFLRSAWSVAALCGTFAAVLLVAPRFRLLHSVNDVERSSAGAVTHPLAIFVCYVFAARLRAMVFYETAMLVLAFSDSSAALAGMAYGRRKYRVEGDSLKSIEGSAIFFLSAFIIVETVLLLATGLSRPDCILVALLIAVLVTLFEAISLHGTDNLFVPLGTIFILAKNTAPSTAELLFQFEALAATFAAAALIARPFRKITRPGLVAVGLGIYTAWGLVDFAWALPMFAALFLACRTDWILPAPADEEDACRVRTAFYLVLVPVLWLLAANLAWKWTGRAVQPLFYPGFLAAIAGQLLLSRRKTRSDAGLRDALPRRLADALWLWALLHAAGFFVFGAARAAEWAAAGGLALAAVLPLAALWQPFLQRWDGQWFPRIRLFLLLPLTALPNAAMFLWFGKELWP